MNTRLCVASLLALSLATTACGTGDHETAADRPAPVTTDDASLPVVSLSPVFPRIDFDRPILVTHAGDGSGRLFVIEQRGRIRFARSSRDEGARVFLDITRRVRMRHNEEGLLGLAFHPDFADNGRFFVYYSASDPRRSVVSVFTVSADDPDEADLGSERVLLEIEEPYGNHNGGTIVFGPDGYLYVAVGDGGWADDPHGHGQNLSTLHAAILRIDVDREDAGRGLRYAIPADNPFADDPAARGEIWAYGLRNVWRMSFDRETGDLWAGDVGQNEWEEIDLIVRGGNYGWNAREGFHAFRGGERTEAMIDPVLDYGRSEGISVTGGGVYRGDRIEALRGAYLYAEYTNGRIWALRYENGEVTAHREIVAGAPRRYITSFGEGPNGEMYICAFEFLDGGGGRDGHVYEIVER